MYFMKADNGRGNGAHPPDENSDAELGEHLMILRETPSELACSVLEDGFRMWPSRVRKIVFTDNPEAPVMGADETL